MLLVAGGSRGIGRAIALGFAGPEEQIVLNYVQDDSAAAEAAAEVKSRGASVHLVKGDISTPEGAAEVICAVSPHVDHLDQVVHSVCTTIGGHLIDAAPKDLARAVEVNAMSLIYLTQAALPLLNAGS